MVSEIGNWNWNLIQMYCLNILGIFILPEILMHNADMHKYNIQIYRITLLFVAVFLLLVSKLSLPYFSQARSPFSL